MRNINNYKTYLSFCISIFWLISSITAVILIVTNFHSPSKNVDNRVNNIKVDLVYICIDKNRSDNSDECLKKKNNNDKYEYLRYSLRSVLKNIPWINKIFIITYAERISFLNDSEERKKKIMYIKTNEILGFNSSSKSTVEHNALHKLDRYNASNYIIYMNENSIINRKMNKNNFFYYSEKERKVVPYIMKYENWIYQRGYDYYYNFYNNNTNILENEFNNSIDNKKIMNAGAFVLLYKYFNRTDIKVLLKESNTWNTALPLTLFDLRELCNMIKEEYTYKDELFTSKESNNKQITFDICYSFYFFNKYKRLRGDLNEFYVKKNNIGKNKIKLSDLLCINREQIKDTRKQASMLKSVLNSFLKHPSIYEKDITKTLISSKK